MDVTRYFPGRLKELREAAGLSQADLARKSGLGQSSIANYEQGSRRPTWEAVCSLAAALGVTCLEFTVEPAPRDPSGPGRPPSADPDQS